MQIECAIYTVCLKAEALHGSLNQKNEEGWLHKQQGCSLGQSL